MATAAEIMAQIEITKRELEASRLDKEAAAKEEQEATERQRLRRVLEDLRDQRDLVRQDAEIHRRAGRHIDADESGPYLYAQFLTSWDSDDDEDTPPARTSGKAINIGSEHVTCSSAVKKGQYTWKIGGMSWLVEALRQKGEDSLQCKSYFYIGTHRFDFCFTPSGGNVGTLSIVHCSASEVAFRYRIDIKRCGGDFVQWGEAGNVFHKTQYESFFGPDVPNNGGEVPQGIFGLQHNDLLKSDWVEDDTLTAKFEIELRERLPVTEVKPDVQVPACTISADLLSLFESGKKSDVTFLVEGEQIHAHSGILCARSEVFEKLLCGGMREAITNQITIVDCDAASFKELLRFAYTDDFGCIESMIGEASQDNNSEKRNLSLQSLLAASHKYALTRLQLWCEQKLCSCLKVDGVCSILCQANLYNAKQLMDACLCFIRQHYEAVSITQKFGELARDWPELMIKIHLFMGQVREDRATPAVEAARKRKRDQI